MKNLVNFTVDFWWKPMVVHLGGRKIVSTCFNPIEKVWVHPQKINIEPSEASKRLELIEWEMDDLQYPTITGFYASRMEASMV